MTRRQFWLAWASGFLAAPAFVHALRAATQAPVSVGGGAVPSWISWAAAPVLGLAAWWLGSRARRSACETRITIEETVLNYADELGGPVVGGARLERAGEPCCGVLVGLSEAEVGHEDDEDV